MEWTNGMEGMEWNGMNEWNGPDLINKAVEWVLPSGTHTSTD